MQIKINRNSVITSAITLIHFKIKLKNQHSHTNKSFSCIMLKSCIGLFICYH